MSAAVERDDAAAVAGLIHPDYTEIDHPTGSAYGRVEALASIVRFVRSKNRGYHIEPLATLGRLLLGRRRIRASGSRGRRFDVGEYENETISLTEVDEQGLLVRCEVFAPDRLGEAIQRLYEMYGESSQDGSARARATRIASVVAVWNGPTKIDHVRTAFAPTTGNIDHRVFSTWDARDREEVLRHFRLQLDLVPDFAGRYNDVVALNDRGVAARMTFFGTARDSGGRIENTTCFLFCFDDVGCISHSELFESEQIEQALARFVELTTDAALPSPAPPPPAVENLAQRVFERNAAFWRARDWDGFTRQLAAGFRFEDRRSLSQVVMDVDAYVRFVRALGDMASARLHIDYLATRGSRLCLAVIHPTVAEGDVGPSDLEYLYVIEADEHERTVSIVAFDRKDLDAAHAELDRRFEAGLADGCKRAWAANRDIAAAINAHDPEAVVATFTSGYVLQDHRRVSWGSMLSDPAVLIRSQRLMYELAPDYHVRVDHVRLTDRGTLAEVAEIGTRDGGEFETPYLWVIEVDEGGRSPRVDLYEIEQIDLARARLAELGAPPQPPGSAVEVAATFRPQAKAREGASVAKHRLPVRAGSERETFASIVKRNLATTSMEQISAMLFGSDGTGPTVEVDRSIFAPEFVWEDRRPIVGLSGGLELFLASAHARLASGARHERRAVVGTAGERVAISHVLWAGGPPDGRFEVEYFVVTEVNEAGLATAVIFIDPDDWRAAQREAWKRWAAIDPVAEEATSSLNDALDAFSEKNLDRVRDIFAEDLVVEDRRRTGAGRLDGREAYLRSLMVLFELAPDSHIEFGHFWLAFAAGGSLCTFRHVGTLRGGGEFENEYIQLALRQGGRTTRMEFFEIEAADAALARFEELRAEIAGD